VRLTRIPFSAYSIAVDGRAWSAPPGRPSVAARRDREKVPRTLTR